MKKLSDFLNESIVEELKGEILNGRFPEVSFELAMQFFLTDGIIPQSGLPVTSFLDLEDWLRATEKSVIKT
jgi:hypothetical protein